MDKIAIREAILQEYRKDAPLLDIELLKRDLLTWLAQIKFPRSEREGSWEECIREYPSTPEEKGIESGVRIRLTVALRTNDNRYLLSVMECLAPDSRGVYIIAVHVNWKEVEWRKQKALAEGYVARFNDVLEPRHTIWVQTFQEKELPDALSACAVAILGNELVGAPPPEDSREVLRRDFPLSFDPVRHDDQEP